MACMEFAEDHKLVLLSEETVWTRDSLSSPCLIAIFQDELLFPEQNGQNHVHNFIVSMNVYMSGDIIFILEG